MSLQSVVLVHLVVGAKNLNHQMKQGGVLSCDAPTGDYYREESALV